MVATVFNLTSASSTVHYFRREGHGRGLGAPANDDGEDSEPIGDMQAPPYIPEGGLVASTTKGWIKDVPVGQTATISVWVSRSWSPAIGFRICASGTAVQGTDYKLLKGGNVVSSSCATGRFGQGGSARPEAEFKIQADPDYRAEGDQTVTLTLTVTSGSATVGSGAVTIVIGDDDDGAYIGQRRRHPYGGSWTSQVLEDHPCP